MQKSQKVIECVKEYIRENYQNAGLSEEIVSKAAGMSPISFSILFKKVTGQTYISYLRKVRMEAAEKMLCQTEEKTYVIAKQVGIDDPNYFSYLFKKQYGVAPSLYREKQKKELYCNKKWELENELLVKQAEKYIKMHYKESRLSAEEISKELGISRIYFSGLFKKVTGQTYVSYVKKIRMEAAAELFLQTKKKVCDIAEETGFEDCNYFSFAFKKYYKVSPIQYREKKRGQRMIS
ncbi:MAG: AraC family transcriptional regulator [Eubacteriales bacterium]|nr:AraC family transcriptional regulator [Eubacteriales bacterium]